MHDKAIRVIGTAIRFRRTLIVVFQLVAIVVANLIAFELRFDTGVPPWAAVILWQTLPWLVAIRAVAFASFKLYEGFWRYTSVHDVRALVSAIATSSLVFFLYVKSPIGPGSYPGSVFFIDAILLLIFLGA